MAAMSDPRTLLIDGRPWQALDAEPDGGMMHVTLASRNEMDEWWPYLTRPTLRYAAPVERPGGVSRFMLSYGDGSSLSWTGCVRVLTLDFLASGARRWLLSISTERNANAQS